MACTIIPWGSMVRLKSGYRPEMSVGSQVMLIVDVNLKDKSLVECEWVAFKSNGFVQLAHSNFNTNHLEIVKLPISKQS